MAIDTCTQQSRILTACPSACYQGSCVDCAPNAGTVCVDANVHSIDSCGAVGAQAEVCTNGCAAGACLGNDCTPGVDTACFGDNIHEVDSCGNLGDFVYSCATGCVDGACGSQECIPDQFIVCYDGDIYTLDSCEGLGSLFEDCGTDVCQANQGGDIECVSGVCAPDAGIACFSNNIHWLDSCHGVQPDIYESCANGCDDNGCLACNPYPIGTTCVGQNRHTLLGGCDSAPVAGDLIESCENGCQQAECLPPGCIPAAGTVCRGDDLHYVDSCGAVGALVQTCSAGCNEGACVTCSPTESVMCFEGHVYSVDSCGKRDSLVITCENGCENGSCIGGSLSCVCFSGCQISENNTYLGSCDSCFLASLPEYLNSEEDCYDPYLCNSLCETPFTCEHQALIYGGHMTLGYCGDCDSCPDCSCVDQELCATYCQ
ncbi:MAG: hypothetical protein A2341_01355 [Deltaproteobacteria bacterium RIFOXYB12_FULL_58_9]|nr:MAG: hypothetical protein A2341_01355 [Deltaproteobacteria bacterium RIFOXYB12_FULL_58_9]